MRVLVVCGGNTCRSPVLSLLLQAELHRIGQDNVEILSAAADDDLGGLAGRMNKFAVEALREVLAPRNDVFCEALILRACEHESRGLSTFSNQHFDLAVFVESAYADELLNWCITSSETDTRDIPDDGYLAFKDAGFPDSLTADPSRNVLSAYHRQTALLLKYAVDLAARVSVFVDRR